jgi:hypothetical protein
VVLIYHHFQMTPKAGGKETARKRVEGGRQSEERSERAP